MKSLEPKFKRGLRSDLFFPIFADIRITSISEVFFQVLGPRGHFSREKSAPKSADPVGIIGV